MFTISAYDHIAWTSHENSAKLERVAMSYAESIKADWRNVEVRKVDESGNGVCIAEWVDGERIK